MSMIAHVLQPILVPASVRRIRWYVMYTEP